VGVVVGGALWGNCNWGGNDIDIDINRENNFNRNTDRNVDRSRTNSKWEHNSDHRKGVGYRDSATQQKYRRGSGEGTQTREQYRGRAEQGRQQMAREGIGRQRDLAGNQIGTRDGARSAQDRSFGGAQNRDLGSNRATTGQSRDFGESSRNYGSSRDFGSSASRSGAFGGSGNAARTRASSNRGFSSRGGMRGGGGRRR
jgi:hypothetical protein